VRLFLTQNLPLKLVSLALATVLWFVIAGEKTSEMGLSVPVELKNFPKDLELTGDAVNAVEVRLRASPSIIQSLGPQEVSAHVDLTGVVEGEHIVNLTADSIRIPFGVKVVRINPSTLTLNLERTVQKVVPVRARLLGRPAPGYEVAEVTINPPEVRVAGPKSRIQEVEGAFTEPVSVEAAQATVVDTVNLGVEDPLLRIQGNPRVRVTARIGPAPASSPATSAPARRKR
jgi:YbbR domain-containing protein